MDFIEFFTENNEFKIQFSKRLKNISWSKYAKYICEIKLLDSINNTVLNIQCSEKEFFNALQSLNEFQMNLGNEISDNIYFQSTMNSYFIYVSNLNYAFLPDSGYTDHPLDDLEAELQMSIYENSINGNILRAYIEMTYIYLETFIYNMYLLLDDIPYLDEMSRTSLLEFMDYYTCSLPN